MVDSQQYLDSNYPLSERSNIRKLDISHKNLTGSLDVSDFINLERLYCAVNNLTNLILPSNSKLTEIHCYKNNLTTLTINKQEYLAELTCSWNSNLTTLIITNNPCLTRFDCSNCQLTTLTLTNNPQLATLSCNHNQLTNLNFLTTSHNENSLTYLHISNNKLTGELATLSPNLHKFTKLEYLFLNSNNLTGSFPILQELSNLQDLHIDNTNITDGLEYLPASLKKIFYSGTKLATELKDYKKDNHYDYQAWRKDNAKLIADANSKKPIPTPIPPTTKPTNPKITTNAQTWLDNKYPKETRKTITILDISKENLEGELDLADFPNLKELIVNSKTERNWESFYNWLNDNIIDINEGGEGKGNIKVAKRSEYPVLSGLIYYNCMGYNCLGLLMNGLENTLGKLSLNYNGLNTHDYKQPLLSYEEDKTFFQLASGSGNTFKCGMSFTLPTHQEILDEYEKLLKNWREATVATNKVLTIKNLTLSTWGSSTTSDNIKLPITKKEWDDDYSKRPTKADNDDLKTQLDIYKNSQADLTTIESILVDLRDKNKSLDSSVIYKYKNALNGLESANKRNENLQSRLGTLEPQNRFLQEDIQEKTGEIANKAAQIEAFKSRIADLNKEISKRDKDIAELRKNAEGNRDKIDDLEIEKIKFERKLKRAEDDLKTAEDERQKLEEKLSDLQKQVPVSNPPAVIIPETERTEVKGFLQNYMKTMNNDYKDLIQHLECDEEEALVYANQEDELKAEIIQVINKIDNWGK